MCELRAMVKTVGYTHLWIALGAMCSAMATLRATAPLSEWSKDHWGIAAAIGLGTGLIYTVQRKIKWTRMPEHMPLDRGDFIAKWSSLVLVFWCICLFIWTWNWGAEIERWTRLMLPLWPVIVLLLVMSAGYASNPFSKNSNGWRDISQFKLPVIATTWGIATVWIPGILSGADAWDTHLMIRALGQAFLIAGLTIPFDVRDLKIDPAAMKTVPQRIGKSKASVLALAFLCFGASLFLIAGNSVAPLVALACAVPCVIYGRSMREEWLYSLLLDGCLIVQGLVIYFLD